jgi:hypothetical protein
MKKERFRSFSKPFASGGILFQSKKSMQNSWQNKSSTQSRHPLPRILPGNPLF